MLALRSLFSVLLAVPLTAQTTHYLQPGDSIQAAVNVAASGDTILLAPGDYFGRVEFLGKELSLVGEMGAFATRITGWSIAPPRSAINFLGGEGRGAVLQGLTINSQNGAVYAVNGMTNGLDGPIIRDCIFQNVVAVGGVFWAEVLNGAFLIEDCWFIDNEGPAVGNIFGSVDVRDSVFIGNLGASVSNAINADGTVTNCSFFDDPNPVYGNLTMRNCLLRGDGTGIGFHGWGLVDRCTIVDFATGVARGNTTPWNLAVQNSVVRDVTTAFVENPSVTWCNVEGGWPGTGNFDLDPLFVDPSSGQRDHHLQVGSPCIDAGNPVHLDPDATRVDVGAFPFRGLYAFTPYQELRTNPSVRRIATSIGGRVALRAVASVGGPGAGYRTLGTLSGTTPGFTFRGVFVPLNPDPLLLHTLTFPNAPPFSAFAGVIGSSGYADLEVSFAPGATAGLEGQTAFFATGLFSGAVLSSVSAPEALEFISWP